MSDSVYLVQLGKNKSAYKTRYKLSSWTTAVLYYRSLNVGYGYKKRLVSLENGKRKIEARMFS